jgi:hypothetical protein
MWEERSLWKPALTPHKKLCVIDMDNIPQNGDVLARHMNSLAQDNAKMLRFLADKVVFLNTMVDRITSHREGDPMVPKAEPVPAKALVILDSEGDLPVAFHKMKESHGVVVRSTRAELEIDLALKLRVANGTHTALAHILALTKRTMTDALTVDGVAGPLLLAYLDALVETQILAAGGASGLEPHATAALEVWQDWRSRLTHPYFGLSSFFITQNGAAKGGIRLGPTVLDLVTRSQTTQPLNVAMAFAWACLLRWLTPDRRRDSEDEKSSRYSLTEEMTFTTAKGVYTGWLQGSELNNTEDATTTYADGLHYNLSQDWYEFRCSCKVPVGSRTQLQKPLSDVLGALVCSGPRQPVAYHGIVRSYLLATDGGNLNAIADKRAMNDLVAGVSTLYARMIVGDDILSILKEIGDNDGAFIDGFATACTSMADVSCLSQGCPLAFRRSPVPNHSRLLLLSIHKDTIDTVVTSEVASAIAIDLHTHLLPPSHGPLCLWGIDELLTYHYLVAEFFITAPASMTPDGFYALPKKQQADTIWRALFVERSPLSEACRGVITVLVSLGLENALADRDLNLIRKFYKGFRDEGLTGAEKFSSLVFSKSGVRYNIMTNIPFDPNEERYWRPKPKDYSDNYRSALRVDPLLTGDCGTIELALKGSGYDNTIEGARQYLRDWCDTMSPEYMMASTPHDFLLEKGTLGSSTSTGINEEALKLPGAFAQLKNQEISCNSTEDDSPSVINENSDFLGNVLMKICEERDLPVALKIGAHRRVNPALKQAGDGMVAFADAGMLGRLCSRFPKVRFLATFLSRNNQHEACVLASKFRNLHIYGCWWFCNNPSIIREITQMRIEMLGTAFTAQHSDARVLDQLLYKWPHSRAVIAAVLKDEMAKMVASGWTPTRAEIRRDVARLFGASYEEFMRKSLM